VLTLEAKLWKEERVRRKGEPEREKEAPGSLGVIRSSGVKPGRIDATPHLASFQPVVASSVALPVFRTLERFNGTHVSL
jgi:hypothetical protein